MPDAARWLDERIARYVAAKKGVDELWRKRTARALRNLSVPYGRNRTLPWFARLGFRPPTNASEYTREMVESLRDTPLLAPTSRQNWTSRLRGFLAFEGRGDLAGDDELWYFPKPIAKKRPYLTLAEVRLILSKAVGRERLVIALGLFNGFRACEIARLKVGDLSLRDHPPVVWILGKGRRGGKPRRVTINPLAYPEIEPFLAGKRPSDSVYPGTYWAIDKDWRRAQRRVGLTPVGTHALRRSFGRLSHDAGTGVPEIQAVYGHSSPTTTTEYIGVEETRMAAGMAKLADLYERGTA